MSKWIRKIVEKSAHLNMIGIEATYVIVSQDVYEELQKQMRVEHFPAIEIVVEGNDYTDSVMGLDIAILKTTKENILEVR